MKITEYIGIRNNYRFYLWEGTIIDTENKILISPNGEHSAWHYQDIIEGLHPDTDWIFEMENDYQGDFFCCGKTVDNKWKFIQGSFGSCSGCDWLMAACDGRDYFSWYEILSHFKKTVIVKDTKREIVEYMTQTLSNVWRKSTLQYLIDKVESTTLIINVIIMTFKDKVVGNMLLDYIRIHFGDLPNDIFFFEQ